MLVYQAMIEDRAASNAAAINRLQNLASDAFGERVYQQRADQLHQELNEEIEKHPGIMALVAGNGKKGKSS